MYTKVCRLDRESHPPITQRFLSLSPLLIRHCKRPLLRWIFRELWLQSCLTLFLPLSYSRIHNGTLGSLDLRPRLRQLKVIMPNLFTGEFRPKVGEVEISIFFFSVTVTKSTVRGTLDSLDTPTEFWSPFHHPLLSLVYVPEASSTNLLERKIFKIYNRKLTF